MCQIGWRVWRWDLTQDFWGLVHPLWLSTALWTKAAAYYNSISLYMLYLINPIQYAHSYVWLCFVLVTMTALSGFMCVYLLIFFRVASMDLGQSYACLLQSQWSNPGATVCFPQSQWCNPGGYGGPTDGWMDGWNALKSEQASVWQLQILFQDVMSHISCVSTGLGGIKHMSELSGLIY